MSGKTPAAPGPESAPALHRLGHRAMATIFEIIFAGMDEQSARDAADAAFGEIDRMERLLSRYKPYSDISRINAAKPGEPVVVEIETAECVGTSVEMYRLTGGAFDITAGSSAAAAESNRGAARIKVDDEAMTVTRLDDGVRLDLGGIGKGYALDRAAELLDEWGVTDALLHGGTSTLRAMGRRPGRDGWITDLRNPSDDDGELGSLTLKDCAFSGSSTAESRHIIDTRTGKAVAANHAAWALADDAAVADALTTALCVMSDQEIKKFATANPKTSFIIGRHVEGTWRLEKHGPDVLRTKTKGRESGTRNGKPKT